MFKNKVKIIYLIIHKYPHNLIPTLMTRYYFAICRNLIKYV